jgi:UrcA family protein
MNRIRSIPLALAAAAISASPAAASFEGRQVNFADLDLGSPAGIATLDARIERAVRQICGDPSPASLQSQREVRRCRSETLSIVQAQRSDALARAGSRSIQMAARGQ